MYKRLKPLIIGFHGCTKATAHDLVCSKKTFQAKHRSYHWLGQGIYFWENNEARALQFSQESLERKGKKKEDAAAVGVVLSLGNCLNLQEADSLDLLKQSYKNLKSKMQETEFAKLQNKKLDSGGYPQLRHLDCAVIDNLIDTHNQNNSNTEYAIDSVMGIFSEGKDLYKGAGIKNKTHIQICIINPNCIKGVFHPKKENTSHRSV